MCTIKEVSKVGDAMRAEIGLGTDKGRVVVVFMGEDSQKLKVALSPAQATDFANELRAKALAARYKK